MSHLCNCTFCAITVTDDDTAGIKINTNVLTIQEDGLAKSINFIGLSTKPVANVEIRIHVDSSLIDATPISFNINRDTTESTWKSISQKFHFVPKMVHLRLLLALSAQAMIKNTMVHSQRYQ